MKVLIPDDWSGEDWQCVKIAWPDSPMWTALLAGLVTAPTRGRWYEESSGDIKAAQAVGMEIFNRNIPFDYCSGEPPAPERITEYLRGAGITIISEEDMGQVVTDVQIVGGKLRVYFGHCCFTEYALQGNTALPIPSPGTTGAIDLSGFDEEPTFAAGSGRASAFVGVLAGVIDIICDSATSNLPNVTVRQIQSAYPDIDFGDIDILTAAIAGTNVSLQGFCSELEDTNLYQYIKADIAALLAGITGDIDSETYEDMVAIVKNRANQWFTLATYPTAYMDMRTVFQKVAESIGANDTRNLLSYAWDRDTDDVSYPDAPAQWQGFDWWAEYDFTVNNQGFTANSGDTAYQAGLYWQGSWGWYSDGSRFGVSRVGDAPGAGAGAVKYMAWKWTDGLVYTAAPQNTAAENGFAHVAANKALKTTFIPQADLWNEVGNGWHEVYKTVPYTAALDDGIMLATSRDNMTQRFQLVGLRIAGTGVPLAVNP